MQGMESNALRGLMDRVEIEEAALRMGQAADQRDWDTLVDCFAGEVYRDYSSLTG